MGFGVEERDPSSLVLVARITVDPHPATELGVPGRRFAFPDFADDRIPRVEGYQAFFKCSLRVMLSRVADSQETMETTRRVL